MKNIKNIVQNLPTNIYGKVSDYIEATLAAPGMNRADRRRLARNWKHVKRKDRT